MQQIVMVITSFVIRNTGYTYSIIMLGRQANTPALIMFYLARARSEDSGEYAQST